MERLSLRRRCLEEVLGPWSEGIWHQYAQKHAYGHGDFGANFHEVSIGLCLNARSSNFLLQIRMLLRLTPRLGVMERSTA
jgi:hypothetical protein